MRRLRKSLLVLAGLGFVVCVWAAHYYYKGFYKWKHLSGASSERVRLRRAETGRLQDKATELKTFLASPGHKYSLKLAFLVDMRLPSGKNRFFVYDLSADTIRMAGLVAHALAWLNQHPRGPFFMWIHLYDPHHPYDPPEPYKSKYSSAPYDGEIAYVDSALTNFVAYLKNLRLGC